MTIAVDTSALMSVVLGEDDAEVYLGALTHAAGDLYLSAVSLVECRIVAETKQGTEAVRDLRELVTALAMTTAPFDEPQAELAHRAWTRFGKGRHPAKLNFGDCAAYALARSLSCPLLFKGNDFAQTDIPAARV